MKKLIAFAALVLLSLPALAAAPFTEGVEYVRLPAPQPVETGAKIEVREFFWYGCPHCYTLEPVLDSWQKTMPKNARFVRTPAVFNDRWAVHARAYYAFEALGLIAKLHGPLFRALHTDKRQLFDVDSLATFVTSQGGNRQAFLDAYNSFGVQASVNRAAQAGQAYGLESVPTLIVDGKYMTSASLTGGHERLPGVLSFLVKKAAAERRASKR